MSVIVLLVLFAGFVNIPYRGGAAEFFVDRLELFFVDVFEREMCLWGHF
jgi:hypothetical protein